MVNPYSPLYLTALTVIANILIHLWLIIPTSLHGKEISMAINDSQSLLDSLLFTAKNNWGISQEEILESMNKISFHESKNVADALQKGGGPGRGLFQFEQTYINPDTGKYEQAGAATAVNRLISQLEKEGYEESEIPSWLYQEDMMNPEVGFDVSKLNPQQQQILFLGNLLQTPNRKEEGYTQAGFYDVNKDKIFSDEVLANIWAQYHQAGTKPGTEEYKSMIDKFIEDLQEGYRKKLIDK